MCFRGPETADAAPIEATPCRTHSPLKPHAEGCRSNMGAPRLLYLTDVANFSRNHFYKDRMEGNRKATERATPLSPRTEARTRRHGGLVLWCSFA
jgi:hypothetical protein